MPSDWQTITLFANAPEKPALGAPCNGCGVCCAAEPCPVSLALLWPHRRPCRALEWHADQQRYLCGILRQPTDYLSYLPKVANPWLRRLTARWIAANTQCDADIRAEITLPPT